MKLLASGNGHHNKVNNNFNLDNITYLITPFTRNTMELNSSLIQWTPIHSDQIQWINQVGSMPMSSISIGLDQVSFNREGFNAGSSNPNQFNTTDSSQMPSDGLSAAQLNPDHSKQMPSSGLSAARLNPEPASTSPFDQLDPLRTQPTSGVNLWDHSSSSQNKGDLASVVRQIENLNRYVTALEGSW